jgi:hypothetical protein
MLDVSNNVLSNLHVDSDVSAPLSELKMLVVDKQRLNENESWSWHTIGGLSARMLPSLLDVVLDYQALAIPSIVAVTRQSNRTNNDDDDHHHHHDHGVNDDYSDDERRAFSSVVRLLLALRPSLMRVNRSAAARDERRDAALDFLAHIDRQAQPILIDKQRLESTADDWLVSRYVELDKQFQDRARVDSNTNNDSQSSKTMADSMIGSF